MMKRRVSESLYITTALKQVAMVVAAARRIKLLSLFNAAAAATRKQVIYLR